MIARIVDISEDGRHLAKYRGFLTVSEKGEELGRVALDDLAGVIANAHGITYSNMLLCALAERNIPLVLCGPNHRPVGFLWSADSHHQQAGRIADQAAATKPLKKRLWQQIVSAKIEQQGAVLAQAGVETSAFLLLARKVRSGDPENVEAQAARRYWPALFGAEFRRDQDGGAVNGLLNYGYAIVRAGAARAVMAAGLHPSLGLAHSNRSNPFCLVDDLIEPFRPAVDLVVFDLVREGMTEVDRDTKATLAEVLILDMATAQGATPVQTCLERAATSLAKCFAGEAKALDLPLRSLPLRT
ncbi:MAG: type II CRISPR-associated endonuclease Cas1 [Pseudomonadota bacterium]